MQKLNRLWQVVNAASTVRDMAQYTRTHYFAVPKPLSLYLHVADAEVEILRWSRPMIEVTTRLQAAFGWRLATDQDEVGVYIAARRRPVVGAIASGRFEIHCPHETFLILKLEKTDLKLVNVEGDLHIPPIRPGQITSLER